MAGKLTPKRQLFVDAFIASGCNRTEAARRAGYAHPSEAGYRLFRNVQVRAAIDERLASVKGCMGADEVLERTTEQATADMADLLDEGGSFDFAKALRLGKTHLIKSMTWGKHGLKVELYNAQTALTKMGEHYNLWGKEPAAELAQALARLLGVPPERLPAPPEGDGRPRPVTGYDA